MMRRVPEWFNAKSQARFQQVWPWAFSITLAGLYFYNPHPFDDLAAAAVTKMRKPLLRATEWMDVHDLDAETLALELPPDQLFGPLTLEQQFVFLLQALKSDNELADGYMARLFIDHMDLSIDPPLISEERILKAGARELLDFAISDFTETREPRKHKFFHPDSFIRLVNWLSVYPTLANHYLNDCNGISLLLAALRHSKEDYSRVLAMRCFMLFALQQKEDGTVEKELLRRNALKTVIDCYRQSTGDPTDTRFLTTLLSSTIRHYPQAAMREVERHNGVEVTLQALNTSRYKGVEQHLRVLKDMRKYFLPPAVETPVAGVVGAASHSTTTSHHSNKKENSNNSNNSEEEAASFTSIIPATLPVPPALPPGAYDVDRALIEGDLIPVSLGVLEVFPEYYESVRDIAQLLRNVFVRTQVLHMKQVPEEFQNKNNKTISQHNTKSGTPVGMNTAPLNTDPLVTPFDLLEYRALHIISKIYVRYQFDEAFAADGTRAALAEIAEAIITDPTCRRALAKEVAPYDLVAAEAALRQMITEESIFHSRPAVVTGGNSISSNTKGWTPAEEAQWNAQRRQDQSLDRNAIRQSATAMGRSGSW